LRKMAAKSLLKKKKPMQDVHFNGVEEFLDYLPEDELKIVNRLREIILQALPDCIERLSYNVPYYKRHANICFVWPPSIPWGKTKQVGVRFGFTKGYLLDDPAGYLDRGERKQVYWKDYTNVKQINADVLLQFLYEAALVDEELSKQKRKPSTKQ